MTRTSMSSLIEDDNEQMTSQHPRSDGPRRRAFTASKKLAHLSAYEAACEQGDGGRYVVAALPDSDCARNIRAAGHTLLSRGADASPSLIEVTDSTLKEHVMRAYPREVPRGVSLGDRLALRRNTMCS